MAPSFWAEKRKQRFWIRREHQKRAIEIPAGAITGMTPGCLTAALHGTKYPPIIAILRAHRRSVRSAP